MPRDPHIFDFIDYVSLNAHIATANRIGHVGNWVIEVGNEGVVQIHLMIDSVFARYTVCDNDPEF